MFYIVFITFGLYNFEWANTFSIPRKLAKHIIGMCLAATNCMLNITLNMNIPIPTR
jgi:hypothetical protein